MIVHLAYDLGRSWEFWRERGIVLRHDGRPLTAFEFEELRAEYLRRGYVVFPPCDSIKANGMCAGHPDATVTP